MNHHNPDYPPPFTTRIKSRFATATSGLGTAATYGLNAVGTAATYGLDAVGTAAKYGFDTIGTIGTAALSGYQIAYAAGTKAGEAAARARQVQGSEVQPYASGEVGLFVNNADDSVDYFAKVPLSKQSQSQYNTHLAQFNTFRDELIHRDKETPLYYTESEYLSTDGGPEIMSQLNNIIEEFEKLIGNAEPIIRLKCFIDDSIQSHIEKRKIQDTTEAENNESFINLVKFYQQLNLLTGGYYFVKPKFGNRVSCFPMKLVIKAVILTHAGNEYATNYYNKKFNEHINIDDWTTEAKSQTTRTLIIETLLSNEHDVAEYMRFGCFTERQDIVRLLELYMGDFVGSYDYVKNLYNKENFTILMTLIKMQKMEDLVNKHIALIGQLNEKVARKKGEITWKSIGRKSIVGLGKSKKQNKTKKSKKQKQKKTKNPKQSRKSRK